MSRKGCKLTKKQEEDFKEAFIIYAIDDDKRVSKDQAGLILRAIGLCPTNSELNDMFSDSRTYTAQELHDIIERQAPPVETEENLLEALRIFDKDGNGYIELHELRHVLTNLGERLKEDEVDQMTRVAEVTPDNMVNYHDMAKMIIREFS